MVPEAGVEPAHLSAGDFKSPVSTYSTIRAMDNYNKMVPKVGLEPTRLSTLASKTRVSTNSTTWALSGAGNEVRTHDLLLGKQTLYQLSYSRI
jgi:hypothetical protein